MCRDDCTLLPVNIFYDIYLSGCLQFSVDALIVHDVGCPESIESQ